MQNFSRRTKIYNATSATIYDEGLRQYFLKIYTLMSIGLAITAISAFSVFSVPMLTSLIFNVAPSGHLIGMTSIGWLVTLMPLGISLYFTFGLDRISIQNAQILFWVYATLMGMSISSLGFVYTGASITKTFLICSSMFGGMSLYGYNTKKDLASMGSFLFMGLMGLVIASLINILFRSPAIEFALSFLGVVIFIGLIAYDTQKLKSLYYQGADSNDKIGVMAAFTLYLDFINLFIYLLRFFGEKTNDQKK